MKDVIAIVLAGGKGTRLEPLTRDRAKPAVPFGGVYRIIDFTLSNCINSDLRKILILPQYKSFSLNRHIDQAWKFLTPNLGEFVEVLPPEQRIGEAWYAGTADAIYQNIFRIEREQSRDTIILAGDHIYKMNYAAMIAEHRRRDADLTIACLPVPRPEARHFGVMYVDDHQRVYDFREKPAEPDPMPGHPDLALASMGIYVFKTRVMFELLLEDAQRSGSRHDFGKDIIPPMLATHRVFAYPFRDENRKAAAYWRDVGTLDAFYQANMDLIQLDPFLNLYDPSWPIHTYQPSLPPPKFVHAEGNRVGAAYNSIVCNGSIVSGGQVHRSLLSPGVRINSFATVEDSILFEGVEVGRHARVRNAIIDKHVRIPPGLEIGTDPALDRSRGLTVSEGGITVVPKDEDLGRFASPIG
ncbi:glucose-1-phosphate adenylyltransferase [Tautonia sociabilis]